jgi:elongator complex protein 1
MLSGGDITLVKVEREIHEERIEIVGNVEGGILAAQWTLDEEVLAIASGFHRHCPCSRLGRSKLLFMTSGFEVIAEISLSPEDITQHVSQVSVGWGRSSTQFRGLRAKDAPRDPTLPEKVDQGVLSPHDDGKVRLHWRADGECLAFIRIEDDGSKPPRRVVRVYSRDGQVESFSEPIDGLEGFLSYRPSGHWIATVQRKSDDEAQVVFLERNGLRHGGFPLSKPGTQIRQLAWNSDSTVIAAQLKNRIQLYTVSNYAWHLKQEIFPLRDNEDDDYEMVWHPEKAFILFVFTSRFTNSIHF